MSKLEIIAVYQPVAPLLTADLNQPAWQKAVRLPLDLNWLGEDVTSELCTTARVLWTDKHLWFGFECAYAELDVDEQFDLNQERYGLWERDVCEAFIRSPLESSSESYKEFEIAP